jgi:hypothetical protein
MALGKGAEQGGKAILPGRCTLGFSPGAAADPVTRLFPVVAISGKQRFSAYPFLEKLGNESGAGFIDRLSYNNTTIRIGAVIHPGDINYNASNEFSVQGNSQVSLAQYLKVL